MVFYDNPSCRIEMCKYYLKTDKNQVKVASFYSLIRTLFVNLFKTHTITIICLSNRFYLLISVVFLSLFKRKFIVCMPELLDTYNLPFFKLSLKRASEIIAPSYNRKIALSIIYKLPIDTIFVKKNGIKKINKPKHIKLTGIIYCGILFSSRDINKGLNNSPENVRIELYGAGDNNYIQNLPRKFNYLGEYSGGEEETILNNSKSSHGLIYYPENSLNNLLCSPNKYFDYLNSNKSIYIESPKSLKYILCE